MLIIETSFIEIENQIFCFNTRRNVFLASLSALSVSTDSLTHWKNVAILEVTNPAVTRTKGGKFFTEFSAFFLKFSYLAKAFSFTEGELDYNYFKTLMQCKSTSPLHYTDIIPYLPIVLQTIHIKKKNVHCNKKGCNALIFLFLGRRKLLEHHFYWHVGISAANWEWNHTL